MCHRSADHFSPGATTIDFISPTPQRPLVKQAGFSKLASAYLCLLSLSLTQPELSCIPARKYGFKDQMSMFHFSFL